MEREVKSSSILTMKYFMTFLCTPRLSFSFDTEQIVSLIYDVTHRVICQKCAASTLAIILVATIKDGRLPHQSTSQSQSVSVKVCLVLGYDMLICSQDQRHTQPSRSDSQSESHFACFKLTIVIDVSALGLTCLIGSNQSIVSLLSKSRVNLS